MKTDDIVLIAYEDGELPPDERPDTRHNAHLPMLLKING